MYEFYTRKINCQRPTICSIKSNFCENLNKIRILRASLAEPPMMLFIQNTIRLVFAPVSHIQTLAISQLCLAYSASGKKF